MLYIQGMTLQVTFWCSFGMMFDYFNLSSYKTHIVLSRKSCPLDVELLTLSYRFPSPINKNFNML